MPEPALAAPTDADAEVVYRALKLDGFFPEFNGELCAKVFPRSGTAAFPSGERLIEQDASGRDLFVLLEGRVSVTQSMGSAALELGQLGPGELLGEMGLLSDGVRKATAQALGAVRAFRLAYEDVGYLLQNNPELAAHLQGLAQRRAS